MNAPLFQHQTTSIQFMADKERVLDASDPGTGKTRVAIEDFAARRKCGGGCALIVAPKSLLTTAWADDFTKFAPYMVTSVATAKDREAAFAVTADAYITNTDAVRWLVKQAPQFFRKFDTLIVDEVSAFKHPTSQRSKALAKIKRYFHYRRALSGTPNANTILDVWHPLFILDDGHRLGKSYYHFRNSVCQPEQVGPQPNMVKWHDRPGAESAVGELIKDITIRHKFEDCVDIPENHEYSVKFHLNAKHMKTYAQMSVMELAQLKSGKVITAVNAAVVTNKLLQISSGAVYDEFSKYHVVDTDRYELIADLVAARRHSIVFFLWAHQRDLLIDFFSKLGITYVVIDGTASDTQRTQAVQDFQAGLYRVMLAHPQSAAHGLTLTRATSTIWASPTYNLEHFLQGNRRIYRAGQTQKTETLMVLAEGTLEEKVAARLADKNLKQMDLLKLLQEP